MALIEDRTAPDYVAPAAAKPIIEAAKVKIVGGMSAYALEDPPAVGEDRTYIVKGTCVKHHWDRVDGEDRLVVDIQQSSIYERGKVPIVDEQPALFGEAEADHEAATTPAEDAPAEEPELPDEDAGQRAQMFSHPGE